MPFSFALLATPAIVKSNQSAREQVASERLGVIEMELVAEGLGTLASFKHIRY